MKLSKIRKIVAKILVRQLHTRITHDIIQGVLEGKMW